MKPPFTIDRRRHGHILTLAAVYVVLVVVFAFGSNVFLTWENLRNIAIQGSTVAMLAIGMTLVVVTAGIDLSVGSIVFVAGVVFALGADAGWPFWQVAVVVVVLAGALGALNGTTIGVLGLNPLLATIATFGLLRGVGEHLTDSQPVRLQPGYSMLGTGSLLGVPMPVLLATVVAVAGGLLFHRTSLGRYLRAIGSSEIGARESGIPARSVTFVAYLFVGVVAGLVSLVTVGRLGAIDPSVGIGLELTVITAVVLGGTPLAGGRGSLIGTLLGAAMLVTVENGLVLIGASPYWYDIFRAVVLLVAVSAGALAAVRGRVSSSRPPEQAPAQA